jgi:CRP-like cAMP-binding protein
MQSVEQYFKGVLQFSDEDFQILFSKMKRVEIPKKTDITKIGKVEKYLSFLEQGIIRLYIPKEENDLTFAFVFGQSFVSAYDSFLKQTPSEYSLATITDSVLYRMEYSDVQDIFNTTSIGNRIGRLATEDLFLKKAKRELDLLNKTAEERYLSLFTERPELIKEIPLKFIASYIGITPQALSRIRKRII